MLQHLFNNWFTNLDLDKMEPPPPYVGRRFVNRHSAAAEALGRG